MSRFSPSCGQLSQVSPDGRLLIWDSTAGMLKQQFAPAAHLAAAVSCAAWRPSQKEAEEAANKEEKAGKKGRKRRSSVSLSLSNGHAIDELTTPNNDLVALGTVSGSILIYSTQYGDVKKSQENAHGKKVNDVVWTSSGTEVYSCSSDGFIGLFHTRKSSFTKFRIADDSRKHKFFSLALHPSESSIVVGAEASIIWVDLDTKLTLATFGGHIGEVTSLSMFVGAGGPAVISHGANEKDHSLSVWNLEEDGEKEVLKPAATLNANEAVRAVTAIPKDDFVLVGCVSTSGVFHAFEYDPSSKRKKNKSLRPKATVQVATDKDPKSGKVRAIPVLASAFSQQDSKVRLAHGSHAKPVFEELDYDTLDKLTCLVRSESEAKDKEAVAADGCKYMVADSTTNCSILGPATGAPKTNGASSGTPSTGGTKRRISESGKVDELPMLERLRLLSKDTEHVTTPPRTDSLIQLLLQGLTSGDSKILTSVLDRADEELIDTTVRKLPVTHVVPLVEHLQKFIKGRGMVGQVHSKWLRSVLQHHTAYLMSNSAAEGMLAGVHTMLEARTRHYHPLMQLKGKLDLITKQIQATPEETSDANVNKEALLVYQDDSSDELSDVMDELLMPASDAEDAWPMGDEDDDDEGSSEDDAASDDDEVEMVNGDEEEEEMDDSD